MDATPYDIRISYRYPVLFTRHVFAPDNSVLADAIRRASTAWPARVLFLVDAGVATAHPGVLAAIDDYCAAHATVTRLAGPVTTIPGGEEGKNDPSVLDTVYRAIHAAGLCRHSYIVAVGGGAALDVVGYAAATAHRGIRLIRIPTTVLAQDDSAVGVKNSINGFGKKNYFGTFAPPTAVINDAAFLTTLTDRDWLGGISEAIKVALIKDATFFRDLESYVPQLVARDLTAMEDVVRRSATLHVEHIATSGDPFESGSSRPLDFGHWAAHRLEALTDHRMRHGEAVAIGVALDATYAHLSGHLAERAWRRILDLFGDLGLDLYTPELDQHLEDPSHPRSLFRGLEEFREHLGGDLTVMLLSDIGAAFDVHQLDHPTIIESVRQLKMEHARGMERVSKRHRPAHLQER